MVLNNVELHAQKKIAFENFLVTFRISKNINEKLFLNQILF